MSEYVSAHKLISEGRLSELMGSLFADETATAILETPLGDIPVTAVRMGVTVFMHVDTSDTSETAFGGLTVRSFRNEAYALDYMDTFRATTGATTEVPQPSDFMVV